MNRRKNFLESELEDYRILLNRIDFLLESISIQLKELTDNYYSARTISLKDRKLQIEREIERITIQLQEEAIIRGKK